MIEVFVGRCNVLFTRSVGHVKMCIWLPRLNSTTPVRQRCHHIQILELMMSTTVAESQKLSCYTHRWDVNLQAGFKLAPPTRNPSTSGCFARSLQFFSLTLPP